MPIRRRHPSTPILLAAMVAALLPFASASAQDPGEPRDMAMDEKPALKNGDVVARAIDRLYPPLLRDAGVEGAAMVWIYVDELGRVRQARLKETSGYVALDEAAQRVAQVMSFVPARRRGAAIPVWISMGISFRELGEREGEEVATADASGAPPSSGSAGAEAASEIPEEPGLTPFTVRPRLQNIEEVRAALTENYPPALRAAGIGGTTNLWFYIDAGGAVRRVMVNESSGYSDMDAAAVEVGKLMRFSPAQNQGKAVPVWVALDVTFATQ